MTLPVPGCTARLVADSLTLSASLAAKVLDTFVFPSAEMPPWKK
jgi:hypothetical protein